MDACCAVGSSVCFSPSCFSGSVMVVGNKIYRGKGKGKIVRDQQASQGVQRMYSTWEPGWRMVKNVDTNPFKISERGIFFFRTKLRLFSRQTNITESQTLLSGGSIFLNTTYTYIAISWGEGCGGQEKMESSSLEKLQTKEIRKRVIIGRWEISFNATMRRWDVALGRKKKKKKEKMGKDPHAECRMRGQPTYVGIDTVLSMPVMIIYGPSIDMYYSKL